MLSQDHCLDPIFYALAAPRLLCVPPPCRAFVLPIHAQANEPSQAAEEPTLKQRLPPKGSAEFTKSIAKEEWDIEALSGEKLTQAIETNHGHLDECRRQSRRHSNCV
jgi:hypothetical protein